jgi:protein-tyrosine phosphatase
MIDLHCHILPNVDDGPQSLEESLRMARFYVADGIRYVVATPHCHRYIRMLRSDIMPAVERLNDELTRADVPLTILPGSEIQVVDTTEYRREFEAGLYCHFNDGPDFTLLEFNWSRELFPADAVQLVSWIRDQKMTPILAHPERFNYLTAEPALLTSMMDAGAWVQITVDSLLGNHGPAPQTAGEAMLRMYSDAVLATDAHNMARCSGMSDGYAWVREHFGNERADELLARGEQVQKCLLAEGQLGRGVHVTDRS